MLVQDLMVLQAGVRDGGPDVCQGVVLQADDVDGERRAVKAVLVHGAPAKMVVMDWQRGEAIENTWVLAGGKLPERVPLLESHTSWSTDAVHGSVVGMGVSGNRVIGELQFAADAASEAKWLKARDGHLNAVSIGARVTKFVYVEPGQSQVVDGVTYTAGKLPLRVNQAWELMEVSLVVFGADPKAKVMPVGGKAAPGGAKRSAQEMKFLKEVLVKMGLVSADADDAAVSAAQAALSAEQLVAVQAAVSVAEAAAASSAVNGGGDGGQQANQGAVTVPVQDTNAAVQAAVAAERQRVVDIRRSAEGLGLDAATVQSAIDAGFTVEQANAQFLQAVRSGRASAGAGNAPVGGAPFSINVGAGRAELANQAMQAALCETLGGSYADPKALGAAAEQQNRVMEEAGRYRGIGLLEMARQSVILRGEYPEVTRLSLVRQAFSSTDFSSMLSGALTRVLMNDFAEASDSTAGLFEEEDLPDYRLVDRIITDPQEQLSPLPEGGTAQHANAGDDKESYQVARYAKQFVVDEILVTNDDLGMVQRTIRHMANAAARLRPELIYAIINSNPTMRDTKALFHADHNNTSTGALAAATLQTAITKMAKQYRLAGKEKVPLNLRAAHLLVPADLEFTALQLVNSVERGDSSGNGTANVLRGRLNVVVDDRMGVNGARHPYTGTVHAGTATNYYLLADRMANTMVVGYLQGTGRRPTVRNFVLDRGQYGVGIDMKHVIGAKPLSWEGWVKSTGQ